MVFFAPVVRRQVVVAEVLLGAFAEFPGQHRVIEQPLPDGEINDRRVGVHLTIPAVVLTGQLLPDLMHLRGLVERAGYEQDFFRHTCKVR